MNLNILPMHSMIAKTHLDAFPRLPVAAAAVLQTVLDVDRRVLLIGQPGIGKSTLVQQLAEPLVAKGREFWCIGADPGSPLFGFPGAVCLGRWTSAGWEVVAYEALCTLDAGRFRLPLVAAVRRLSGTAETGVLLVDSPGVVRGVAGAELLAGLSEAAGIDTILAMVREGRQPPLEPELRASSLPVFIVTAVAAACCPSKAARARARSRLWDAYLCKGQVCEFNAFRLQIVGTAPPLDVPSAWSGRQVAFLEAGRTICMGEVLGLQDRTLRIRLPIQPDSPEALTSVMLVRDAVRLADGRLGMATPFAADKAGYLPPPDPASQETHGASGGPRFAGRVGALDVSLVNGVLGDPLLHVRLRHQRRSLLFDLGEGSRLPARIAHQVSDVFISHAHIDHIKGFLWLLRSRIGDYPPCRIYGPPGIADNIEGLVRGILWDWVENRGPRFEVTELYSGRIRRFLVQGGRPGCHLLGEETASDGVLRREPGFLIRAVRLDHSSTVLAFALEPLEQINVRKDRLLAWGLAPGPWLGEFKRRILERQLDMPLSLPDGTVARVGELAAELVQITAGKKLVYATDLADTPENRQRLVALARNAHTFFCEASFREKDLQQASATAHLTTCACAEIAEAAGVARLVPFHFSRRYENEVGQLYEEIAAIFARVVIPASV